MRFVYGQRMRWIALLIISVGLLSTAGAAQAAHADGQLWELSKLADAWWEKRGVGTCASTIPSIAKPYRDDLPQGATMSDVEGFSYGTCSWSLTPWRARETRSEWDGTIQDLAYECAVGVHENGHARGLEHNDPRFPIMTDEGVWNEIIPGKCWGWAKKIRNARRR